MTTCSAGSSRAVRQDQEGWCERGDGGGDQEPRLHMPAATRVTRATDRSCPPATAVSALTRAAARERGECRPRPAKAPAAADRCGRACAAVPQVLNTHRDAAPLSVPLSNDLLRPGLAARGQPQLGDPVIADAAARPCHVRKSLRSDGNVGREVPVLARAIGIEHRGSACFGAQKRLRSFGSRLRAQRPATGPPKPRRGERAMGSTPAGLFSARRISRISRVDCLSTSRGGGLSAARQLQPSISNTYHWSVAGQRCHHARRTDVSTFTASVKLPWEGV